MYDVEFESLKLADFDNFVDVNHILSLWHVAILDTHISHYHIQGPRWSGKTHVLEATLHNTHDMARLAVCLSASDFNSDTLLEINYADWFYMDDVDNLQEDQQSIFIAWLNQCIAQGKKIFTTSGLKSDTMCGDLYSRLQSSFLVTLDYPRAEEDWYALVRCFFLRHHINVPIKIIGCILDVAKYDPQIIFPLMMELAHQPKQLSFQRVHTVYRNL